MATNLYKSKQEEGTGQPSLRWILSYACLELFPNRGWFYAFLCILAIGLAVIYNNTAIYWGQSFFAYAKRVSTDGTDTQIIINCKNIENPSSMFSEKVIEDEFRSDPRFIAVYPRKEMSVKLSVRTEDPVIVSTEGIIPKDPVTSEGMMLYGRGISSLTAREIVISDSLYRKFWGKEDFTPDKTLNLNVSRTVNNKSQAKNFSVSVVGVLKSQIWNRAYIPLKLIEHIDMWCDNQIDVIPSEGQDVLLSMPEPEYESGLLFVRSSTPEEIIKKECDYHGIRIEGIGKPFFEIETERETVWFSVKPKKGLITKSMIENMTEQLPQACAIEAMEEALHVELFSGDKMIHANILGVFHDDSRLEGLMYDRQKTVSDILKRGEVLLSEKFSRRLEILHPKGRCPDIMKTNTSPVSNILLIGGVIKDGIIDGDWDVLCVREMLELARQSVKSDPVCIVSTSNPILGYHPDIQEHYGHVMNITSKDITEFLFFKPETSRKGFIPLGHDLFGSRHYATSETIPTPKGYEDLYGCRIFLLGYERLGVFLPDDFLYGMLQKLNVKTPRGSKPAILVVSDKIDKSKIYLKAEIKRVEARYGTPVVYTLCGPSTFYIFPESLPESFIKRIGFIKPRKGVRSSSLLRTEETKDVLELCNRIRITQNNFLFKIRSTKEKAIPYFKVFRDISYHMAEVLQLPDIGKMTGYNGINFAVADADELAKLPYRWAKDYKHLGEQKALTNEKTLKDPKIKIGQTKVLSVRKLSDEQFPTGTVFLPVDTVRNNPYFVVFPEGFNRLDVGCSKRQCGNVMYHLEEINSTNFICISEIRSRKLQCYNFVDGKSADGKMDKNLMPTLATRNPPFTHVLPNLTVEARHHKTKEKFYLTGTTPRDPRQFMTSTDGEWINPDGRGVILPMSALKGSTYEKQPENLIGKTIEIGFEKEVKRSFSEPMLIMSFRIDGLVSGDTGYMLLDIVKKVTLWKTNDIAYLDTEERFVLPGDISRGVGHAQLKAFVKDLETVREVSTDLRARGYRTYDSLEKQENLSKLGKVTALGVVFFVFAAVISGTTTVMAVTMMNKESRIHEMSILLAYGAGRNTIFKTFLASAGILSVCSFLFGMVATWLIHPIIREIMRIMVVSIPIDQLLTVHIFDPKMWWIYVLTFFIAYAFCMLSVCFAYLRVRKLSVTEIRRRQF